MMRYFIVLMCFLLFPITSFANEYMHRKIDTNWGISKSKVVEFENSREDSSLVKEENNRLTFKLSNDSTTSAVVYSFGGQGMEMVSYYDFIDNKQINERYQNGVVEAKSILGEPIMCEKDNCTFAFNENTAMVVIKDAKHSCIVVSLGFLNNQEEKTKRSDSEYVNIDIIDFKLDFNKLKGKKIKVSGVGLYMMDALQLSKKLFDGNSIMIDTEKLPRNQRKFILTRCSEGCNLTVYGEASEVFLGMEGIIANKIKY